MNSDEIAKLDLKHTWHPCSQMKDYEEFQPIAVKSASGPYLYTHDGQRIIDAISSWWCKSLGHGHPQIKAAVSGQMDKFEHIIMANTCNETIAELSAELAKIAPGLDKVFYADNGSTAVEIAIKMCLQYHQQTGNTRRQNFVSLENGYHGETILTLAAGDCELYSKPYIPLMPDIPKLKPMAYVNGENDPGWKKFSEAAWAKIEAHLNSLSDTLAGIIFEPIVQGSGGMKIYSPDLLKRLRRWADSHGVMLIADEIMTGFGRTGKMLACEHAGITPDFICLSKGLTAGWGPMSVVLCSSETYQAFYDDYFSGKGFLHSNTFTGYALAAAAALETINIYKTEKIVENVAERSSGLLGKLQKIADKIGALRNVRGIGFIAAADIVSPSSGKPYPREERMGYQVYREAVKQGALLRPLGDTIYFFPPLNTPESVLNELAEIAEATLERCLK